MTRWLLGMLIGLALGGGVLRAQPLPASDPFRGVRSHEYLPDLQPVPFAGAARLAIDSAHLAGNGHPYRIVRRRVGGHVFYFLEGWSGVGTGAWQTSFWLFQVDTPSGVHLAWQGTAGEEVHAGDDDSWSIRSCLVLSGDSGFGYMTTPAPPQRRSPLPASGYYRFDAAAGRFFFAYPPDATLGRRCARLPHRVRKRAL